MPSGVRAGSPQNVGIRVKDVGSIVGKAARQRWRIWWPRDGTEGGEGQEAGMYADGAGLYLQVSGDGEHPPAKFWIFRFTFRGRSREMGLGSFSIFGLAEARTKAAECRRQVYDGIDPIAARRTHRAQAALEAAARLTFKENDPARAEARNSSVRFLRGRSQYFSEH
jgi:hypothetical protein